jgi:hypothetical protein
VAKNGSHDSAVSWTPAGASHVRSVLVPAWYHLRRHRTSGSSRPDLSQHATLPSVRERHCRSAPSGCPFLERIDVRNTDVIAASAIARGCPGVSDAPITALIHHRKPLYILATRNFSMLRCISKGYPCPQRRHLSSYLSSHCCTQPLSRPCLCVATLAQRDRLSLHHATSIYMTVPRATHTFSRGCYRRFSRSVTILSSLTLTTLTDPNSLTA